MSKGSRLIFDFLNEIRSIVDELALAHILVYEEDLMVHILTQIGDEYNSIIAALKVRKNPISYPELFDKLVDFERSLIANEPNPTLLVTINATQRQQV